MCQVIRTLLLYSCGALCGETDGIRNQTLSATGFARKTELVEMAGGLYPLAQVASLLNVSEEIVEDRHKAGMLIAVRSGGKYGYPACQFTSDGIVEGLAVSWRPCRCEPIGCGSNGS